MNYKLEDVAEIAGVSKTTVSRVINKRGYLSQTTIDKVHDAMAELNYQPNAAAQQLQKKKTNIVGLLFPSIANPFFGELVETLEKKLYQKGYTVIVGDATQDAKKEEHYLKQLLSRQVDGLIVGTHNFNIQTYNKYHGLPIVSIERILNDEIPTIAVNNYQGGVLATEFLIKQGAKKIIHTTDPFSNNMPSDQRHQGYLDTMLKHHLTPITWQIDFEMSYAQKTDNFTKMLQQHGDVDAIFASNDVEATQMLPLVSKMPSKPIVVGFDGTQLIQAIFPNMPTIVQPIEQLASVAIEVLEKRIAGEATNTKYLLDVTLSPQR